MIGQCGCKRPFVFGAFPYPGWRTYADDYVVYIIHRSVINAFKSMLQEDDAIGPEDVEILDKMKQFAEKIETQYPPTRLLFSIIDNKVRDPLVLLASRFSGF
jgi:hypothetical protein